MEKGFDWIWNVVPQISIHQIVIATIGGYAAFISGIAAVYPVFAQNRPLSRCTTILDEEQYKIFNFSFKEHQSMTGVKDGRVYSDCLYYNKSSIFEDALKRTELELQDGADIDTAKDHFLAYTQEQPFNNNTLECDRMDAIFDNSTFTETISTEFVLICDYADYTSYATSISFIGLFFGAFFGGMLADKYGRKTTIIWSILATAISLLLQSTVPGYPAFLLFRVAVMGFNHMAYVAYCGYCCEIVGPQGRKISGMVPCFMFSFGYMFLSAISYTFRDWRDFTLALAVLTAPFVFSKFFWPESPRWLYSKKKYQEGEEVIRDIIKKTNTSLSEFTSEREFFDKVIDKVETENIEDNEIQKKEPSDDAEQTYSVATLFTSGREMAMISLNVCFQFSVLTMAYYGLSYSAGNLPGNIFVNNVFNGLAELLAYILCAIFLDRFGRRLFMAVPLIFGGGACIAGMVLDTCIGTYTAMQLSRMLMIVGKFGVSAAFAVIWVYAAELYPTNVRTIALGMGSMAGRVGGILSPQINKFYATMPWLPPTIFGIVCITGGFLNLVLPETTGQPMLSSIDEANAFYRKKSSKK